MAQLWGVSRLDHADEADEADEVDVRGFGAEEQAGWRPGTTVAAGVLALVLVAGGMVALLGGGSDRSGGTPEQPAVAAVPAEVGQARPGAAGGGHVPVVPLLTAPPVTWQLFSGVALPSSPTAGPRTVTGPVYAGFARSQEGALLAAAQLSTRYLLTPGEGWREVVERQVLPGAGRDAFVRARAQVTLDDPPGTYGQLAGFRVVTFTPDVAVVQLVTRFPTTGRLQVTTTMVKWVDGDWRLELQPDGGTSPTAQPVTDLDGFVVWGA